jgi:hypothetical protein
MVVVSALIQLFQGHLRFNIPMELDPTLQDLPCRKIFIREIRRPLAVSDTS